MTTLFVANLPRDVREREVEDLFYKYGRIEDVQVRSSRTDTFAFVTYRDSRDARDAVVGRDGYKFDGYRIKVEFRKGRGERGEGGDRDRSRGRNRSRSRGRGDAKMVDRYFKLSISGLPEGTSWQDLKDHIKTVAPVRFTEVSKDGSGMAGFSTREDLLEAIAKLDDTNMKSHTGATSYIRLKEVEVAPMPVDKQEERRDDRRSRSRSDGGNRYH